MSNSTQDMTIADIAKTMAKIDKAMLVTRHGDDSAARPMSNNKDVEFDGDTYFFTTADTTTVEDIKAHDRVSVTYQDTDEDTYIALSGTAKLHTARETLEKHWKDELDAWFDNGLDTDGLTLIAVNADRVHYWIGREGGEIVL
ncbi:MAG: pyridoxamine 5'-phosphate oxidase family protein [Litorimonas sp.]